CPRRPNRPNPPPPSPARDQPPSGPRSPTPSTGPPTWLATAADPHAPLRIRRPWVRARARGGRGGCEHARAPVSGLGSPPMPVRIVTDSAADLPADEADRLGVAVVPLSIRFGADEYTDGVDLSVAEFYNKLATASDLPETT